ncbi:25611_t:CDS:1, partial [Gigaspora margarita]
MHVDNNQDNFAHWLLQLGNGLLSTINNKIQLPSKCIVTDLITNVFGENILEQTFESLYKKVILCPTNKECLTLNKEIIYKLPDQLKTYKSIDKLS